MVNQGLESASKMMAGGLNAFAAGLGLKLSIFGSQGQPGAQAQAEEPEEVSDSEEEAEAEGEKEEEDEPGEEEQGQRDLEDGGAQKTQEEDADISPVRTRRGSGGVSASGGVKKTKPKKEWHVGDNVQAFMGKTGPYMAVVREVHGSGPSDREYTLDWEDCDPNGRRQPATNVIPAADSTKGRKPSQPTKFVRLSPARRAEEAASLAAAAKARASPAASGKTASAKPTISAAAPAKSTVQAASTAARKNNVQAAATKPKAKDAATPAAAAAEEAKPKAKPERKPSKRIKQAVKKGKIFANYSMKEIEKANREKAAKEEAKLNQARERQLQQKKEAEEATAAAVAAAATAADPFKFSELPHGEAKEAELGAILSNTRTYPVRLISDELGKYNLNGTGSRDDVVERFIRFKCTPKLLTEHDRLEIVYPDNNEVSDSDSDDDQELYLPEKILEKFKRGAVEYYKVSWQGYDDVSEERCAEVDTAPQYVPLLKTFNETIAQTKANSKMEKRANKQKVAVPTTFGGGNGKKPPAKSEAIKPALVDPAVQARIDKEKAAEKAARDLDRLVPLDTHDGDDQSDSSGAESEPEDIDDGMSGSDTEAAAAVENEINRRDVNLLNLPADSYFDKQRRSARRKRKKQPAQSLLDAAATTDRPTATEVEDHAAAIRKEFGQWHHHLMRDFNLLLYGYGSKRVMMEQFAKSYCSDASVVVVKGFLPTVKPKSILQAVSQALFNPHDINGGANGGVGGTRTFRSLVEQRTFIAEALCRGGIDEVASNSFRAATAAPEVAKPRAQWAVGDVVLGQYADGNTFEATISEVHDDGDRYIVNWADGDLRNRELTRREVFALSGSSELVGPGRARTRKAARKRGCAADNTGQKNAADKDWQDFTAGERSAAQKIGFDESAWQKGSETPFKKNWSDLTEDEKSAAELIGYSKARFVELFSQPIQPDPSSPEAATASVNTSGDSAAADAVADDGGDATPAAASAVSGAENLQGRFNEVRKVSTEEGGSSEEEEEDEGQEDQQQDEAEVKARRSHRISARDTETSSQRRLYIVVHDIDGPGLAKIPAQETLCFLASLPGVHVIASINNIHAPLLWNWTQACNLARYNWAWCEASTYSEYELESLHLYSDANSAAGMSGKVRGAAIVLASLPDKTREVFKLLAERQREDANEDKFTGLPFHEYYTESRTKFLTSSEDNFKTLLHELDDHKIIVSSKLRGVDSYRINFNDEQIQKIVRDMASTNGVGEDSGEEDNTDVPAATAAAAAAAAATSGNSESVTEECYLLDLPVGGKSLGVPLSARVQKSLDWSASVTDKTLETAITKDNVDLFAAVGAFISSSGWRRELPAALLLTGLNVADHEHSFLHLKQSLRRQLAEPFDKDSREKHPRLVRPSVARVGSANAGSLETLMLAIISGLMKGAGAHNAGVSNTLYLQRWYNSLDDARRPTHLIVMIQDVESIRSEIVQDMVRILSSAKNRLDEETPLPLYLVMGFATSTDALSSVLTHRERSLVVAQRFVLQPARRTLNVLLDSLLDHRDWSGLGAVARPDDREQDLDADEVDVSYDDEPASTAAASTAAAAGPASPAAAAAPQPNVVRDGDASDDAQFDMTQQLESNAGSDQAGSFDSQYELTDSPKRAAVVAAGADADDAVSMDGSQEAVSAGASSNGLELAPSAGSSAHAGQADVAKDNDTDDRQANRQAKKNRMDTFVSHSHECSKTSYPVAVSLPQLSEGAMGQLVDNFFYCNFEIDSFRKHIAFGISHHFFHQKLSFLCSYVGGDGPVDQMPTLNADDLGEIRQLKSVEKWLEDGSPDALLLKEDSTSGAQRGYKKRFNEVDDVTREQAHKWLLDLRQQYSRLPAVLRLLHHAFVECALIKKARLADTIRYVQQYLVSAEEQESSELRNKLKAELLGLSTTRLLKLVTQWADTLRAHSSWVSRQSMQTEEDEPVILEADPIMAMWMLKLVDIEGQLKREAGNLDAPAPGYEECFSDCDCRFLGGCACRRRGVFLETSSSAETEPAAASSAGLTTAATGLNPAMRRKMALAKAAPKPVATECAEKIRRSIFQLATEWIDLHLDVDVWRPASLVTAAAAASGGSGPARRRPLAEAVVWNGRSALRKYRQPKVQPRDSIVQGTSTAPNRTVCRPPWLSLTCLSRVLVCVCDAALLQPKHMKITRHDTGAVYLLLRERGDRTKLSGLSELFFGELPSPLSNVGEFPPHPHPPLPSPRSVGLTPGRLCVFACAGVLNNKKTETAEGPGARKGKRRAAAAAVAPAAAAIVVALKDSNRRMQKALVELQTMGFVKVNAKTVIKQSLFFSDLENLG